jgi:hypothetical protein
VFEKANRDLISDPANNADHEETARSDRAAQKLPQSAEGAFPRLSRCSVTELAMFDNGEIGPSIQQRTRKPEVESPICSAEPPRRWTEGGGPSR